MIQLPKIFKKTKTGATQTWSIEVDGNKYRTYSGQLDGKIQTSEWTICEGKNIGKANETTPEKQTLKEAQALHKNKLEHGYFENISSISEEQYFQPMLAKDFLDYKDSISFPVYSQVKLDGVRSIVNESGIWTRNGKKIISAPHIREALQPIFDKFPQIIFDGELYNHDLKNDFNTIVSLIKKTKPSAQDLKESEDKIEYHIYDLPSFPGNFGERSKELFRLQEEFGELWPKCCKLLPTDIVSGKEEIEPLYIKYIEEGYEGQMIRLDASYENKRSKNLLKHKTFQDEEFVILDIFEGVGNRSGTAGYMTFEREGKPFKSNIKGDWKYLKEVLEQKDSLIGRTATVTYFALTPAGIPRFPYVTKINREEYE
jgi:DNA ligase-1